MVDLIKLMEMRYLKIAFALAIALSLLAACSDADEKERAVLQFRLTDDAGDYQEVNIDVKAIHVIVNDSLVELNTNQGVYNLLEFVNGKDTLIADDQVPDGFISQIRLVLGEANTLKIDDEFHELKTPSAQQSGLKLNIHNELVSGETYVYILDFVVEESIVEKGNGGYSLKPVIRVFTEAITGSVSGVVMPAEARPLVRAFNESDTHSTYSDTMTGEFLIRGLDEGSYQLEFQPLDPYSDTLVDGIEVLAGETTEVDTLFFE